MQGDQNPYKWSTVDYSRRPKNTDNYSRNNRNNRNNQSNYHSRDSRNYSRDSRNYPNNNSNYQSNNNLKNNYVAVGSFKTNTNQNDEISQANQINQQRNPEWRSKYEEKKQSLYQNTQNNNVNDKKEGIIQNLEKAVNSIFGAIVPNKNSNDVIKSDDKYNYTINNKNNENNNNKNNENNESNNNENNNNENNENYENNNYENNNNENNNYENNGQNNYESNGQNNVYDANYYSQYPIVVYDLEMTGLNPFYDKIIEIGAVYFSDAPPYHTFESMVYTDRELSELTRSITGITQEEVKKGRPLKDVLIDFVDYVGEYCILIAHGGDCADQLFLQEAFAECGMQIPMGWEFLDSYRLAQYYQPLKQNGLKAIIADLHIERGQSHRALDDSIQLLQVLLKFENIYQEDIYQLFYNMKLRRLVR